MRQVFDGHIHSRYSRACSKDLTLENIAKYSQIKGIDIVATGDFTHPQWFSFITKELVETRPGAGLYKLRSGKYERIKFLLSTEVALIYKDGGRARRIHLVIHAPNIAAATELNRQLGLSFNLKSDGRPILGTTAPKLVALCLQIDPKFIVYPAHIWTPWFSVFGSKSGFDFLEECFHEQTENIFAFETGLSSDPEMNDRVSALDNLACLSNSDAHSPMNIGREANVLEMKEESYADLYQILKNEPERIVSTIEFYPEEGMYHFDGHRACGFSCAPAETKKLKGICPKCRRPLTVGVAYRLEELADREIGTKKKPRAFQRLVGLDKIIAESFNIKSRSSQKVRREYDRLIGIFGSEINILLYLDLKKFKEAAGELIALGVERVRAGKLIINPGFDGEYGRINIFSEAEVGPKAKQIGLF
ncbi:MAG TPA: endonuclease Q family protein [bacterium]|nr:endonuclease Q family protein [bacterium]HPT29411.1 endonuclease Q family protein [bacterium]